MTWRRALAACVAVPALSCALPLCRRLALCHAPRDLRRPVALVCPAYAVAVTASSHHASRAALPAPSVGDCLPGLACHRCVTPVTPGGHYFAHAGDGRLADHGLAHSEFLHTGAVRHAVPRLYHCAHAWRHSFRRAGDMLAWLWSTSQGQPSLLSALRMSGGTPHATLRGPC